MQSHNEKIIFLDFVRVLQPKPESWPLLNAFYPRKLARSRYREIKFDSGAVCNLNSIIRRTGAGVVITSAERVNYDCDPTLLQLCLKFGGVNCKVVGVTPDWVYRFRGQEIIKYWDQFSREPTHYCIIDNSLDFFPEQTKHLVCTLSPWGLTASLAERAVEILTM